MNVICEFFQGLCLCLYWMIWPTASLVLGTIGGVVVGTIMTLLIFGITLIRLPMHICKTLYVTATTDEGFIQCQSFDPFLRILVFLLVPIPHLLWLVGITLLAATAGNLYYISRTTRTVFKHQYAKAFAYGTKTMMLHEDSLIGNYVQFCQSFMEEDGPSIVMILTLKALCSFLPGLPLGALPFVPLTIAIVLITLFRLPINFLLSMKVAVKTVALEWDLKILALLMLPIAHTVFPLVVFVGTLLWSFVYFVSCTTISIFESGSPFENWGEFRTMADDYYKMHQEFVGEHMLGKYNHPTGIPLGWRGETYGLPIHHILQWQWDFLVCTALLLVSTPVCLVGSTLVFGMKIIPGTVNWWKKISEQMAREETAECLGCWAFYVAGYVLTPVGTLVTSLAGVACGTLLVVRVPAVYLKYGYLAGFYESLHVIHDVDNWDIFSLGGFRAFGCLPENNPHKNGENRQRRRHRNRSRKREFEGQSRMVSNAYWDRFAHQCIQSTFHLLAKEWITHDQIECMDSSIVQSIPAVAALTVLVDTIHDPEAKKPQDISWKLDGTLCKEADRPPLDGVATLLLPKVMEVKRLLKAKKGIAEETNVERVTAMICSNTDEPTKELEGFLKTLENDKKNKRNASNAVIRAKLTELTLMMLQVQPFRERMTTIFGYDYAPVRDLEAPKTRAEEPSSVDPHYQAKEEHTQTKKGEDTGSWMARIQLLFGQA